MSYFAYQGMRVYYQEYGEGTPWIFLHGNTASSRMFEPLLPLYQSRGKIVLIDFLGNGQSERLPAFPSDIWADQGRQVVELCRRLGYAKANLVGTSGGAYAAIHAGFQAPELFGKIVADSFDGSTLPNEFARSMTEERRRAKEDPSAREFYRWCQGEDWERVVDQDTEALVHLARRPGPLFPRPIGEIQCPLLVTVSREDEMLSGHCIEESKNWTAAAPQITCRIFETGGHPLIYSQAKELAALICDFFEEAP